MNFFANERVSFHFMGVFFWWKRCDMLIQIGVYSQNDWTKSIDKTKFNQLVDDAAQKFEVAQAVNFANLVKLAQLQAQFSQLQSEYNNYFK